MSTKPENFIMTSDFATLKNDTIAATATVVVPGSVTVGSNSSAEWHTDIPAGTAGAALRCRIQSSNLYNYWMVSPQVTYTRTGSLGNYTLVAYVYLVSPGILRCSCSVYNTYGSTMTTQSGNETVNFSVSTFIPPFA